MIMIGYRTHFIAIVLLCASTALAQKRAPRQAVTQQPAPSFPIVAAADTTGLTSYAIRRSLPDAASLAFAWLDKTGSPALDSIDFPPGLVASLRNALLHLERRMKDIPALDSARELHVVPRDWDGRTGGLLIDTKRNPWITPLLQGKKKTGNRTIDRLVAAYGLHASSRFRDGANKVIVTFMTDSIVNIRGLVRTLYAMKGMEYVDEIGIADRGWRTVMVSVVDGKWRFEYEFADELHNLGWHRFTWLFDVAPDGTVTHVSSSHVAPRE